MHIADPTVKDLVISEAGGGRIAMTTHRHAGRSIDLSAPIIDEAGGTILDGDYFPDGAHPSNAGYNGMATSAVAPVQAWCEATAGQAL